LLYRLLFGNQLSGTIPPDLGKLTKLYWLYLFNNQLCGNVPSELGHLEELQILYLFDNQFNGVLPELHVSQYCDVSENSQLCVLSTLSQKCNVLYICTMTESTGTTKMLVDIPVTTGTFQIATTQNIITTSSSIDNTTYSFSKSIIIAIAFGIVFGIVVIAIIVVGSYFVWKSKRHHKSTTMNSGTSMKMSVTLEGDYKAL